MTQYFVGSDIGTRLFDYIQEEKINQLYNQTVDRVEKSLIKQKDASRLKGVKGEGGLGEILAYLGLKLSVAAELQSETADSEQVVYELSAEQKLRIVWRHLYMEGLIAELNQYIMDVTGPDTSPILFMFRGEDFRFSLVDTAANPHDDHTLIYVQGMVEGYRTEFYCSRMYFHGSALFFDIQRNIARDVTGIAAIKAIDHSQKKVSLNPIAF